MNNVCRDFRERMTMAILVVTLAVCLVPGSAAASSRVLVVHNNTDATLVVVATNLDYATGGYTYREEEVLPNTKKSLFNFLSYGRNEVHFQARYVSPAPQPVVRTFIAERTGVQPKVVELFPRDFGRSVMFDGTDPSGRQGSARAGGDTGSSPEYLGCFAENSAADPFGLGNRVLGGAMRPPYDRRFPRGDPHMTTATCIDFCRNGGWAYAGTQYAGFCFCGNSYDTYGNSNNCTDPCNGAKNETCGGPWANSVYRVR